MAFRQQQAQRNAYVQDRAFQENQNRYTAQSERQATADQMAFGQETLKILSSLPPEQRPAAYMARVEEAAATVGLPQGFDPVQGWQKTEAQLPPYQPPTQAAPDLVETVGPDGNPILTPKPEAAGMQPYKAPQKPPNRRVVKVAGPDGKPLFEFEDVAVEQGLSPYVEPKDPKGVPTPADVAAQEAEAEAFRTMLTSSNFADSVGPWDNLSAGFFGLFATEDKLMNREVGLAANEMILSAAKNLKGNLSDKDVRFLQDSMPKPSDREEIWYRWYNKTFLRKVNAARKTLDLPPIEPLDEGGTYESDVQSLVDKYADKG